MMRLDILSVHDRMEELLTSPRDSGITVVGFECPPDAVMKVHANSRKIVLATSRSLLTQLLNDALDLVDDSDFDSDDDEFSEAEMDMDSAVVPDHFIASDIAASSLQRLGSQGSAGSVASSHPVEIPRAT
jgi:hypothetical protein